MKKMIRTGIIDDEPFVRADLRHLLSAVENIDIVWEADTFDEARKRLMTRAVDLVFLDIRLKGGSGLDLIPLINPDITRLILVTAHEKYLSHKNHTAVLDCLLKPVSSRELVRVMNHII